MSNDLPIGTKVTILGHRKGTISRAYMERLNSLKGKQGTVFNVCPLPEKETMYGVRFPNGETVGVFASEVDANPSAVPDPTLSPHTGIQYKQKVVGYTKDKCDILECAVCGEPVAMRNEAWQDPYNDGKQVHYHCLSLQRIEEIQGDLMEV